MADLTLKQEAFVREYLVDFNGAQAAIRAGYSERSSRSTASELLTKPNIIEAIREKAMSAEEVLVRLTDIGRGDFADIFDITSMGFVIDLQTAQEKGKTKLIKKIKQRTTISSKNGEETEIHDLEVELYSALDALVQLAKYHKLLTDKTEVTGKDGGPQLVEIEYVNTPYTLAKLPPGAGGDTPQSE